MMRGHTLEASHDLTYAQMGRFVAKPGTPKQFTDGHGATSIDQWALLDPKTPLPEFKSEDECRLWELDTL